MKKKLVVLTGAGISAESGIATFRDSNGLWENHRVEDVASPEGFAKFNFTEVTLVLVISAVRAPETLMILSKITDGFVPAAFTEI